MVLEEFLTVHWMVYEVFCSALGGMGPVFIIGPLKWSACAARLSWEATETFAVAIADTCCGALCASWLVPATSSERLMVGLVTSVPPEPGGNVEKENCSSPVPPGGMFTSVLSCE